MASVAVPLFSLRLTTICCMDPRASAKQPHSEIEGPPVIRSKIWYSDGSAVLQAEATQFRVHASLLSAASTVFKDMFDVAQSPENSQSQVDGCPLIQLYDDKAHDVEFLLDALYDRNFYRNPQKGFDQVAAMWRLGKKYGFDELRDDARGRLEHFFPANLADFQARFYASFPQRSQISVSCGMVFDAINLARSTGLLSILPAALYLACTRSPHRPTIQHDILFGIPGADGANIQLSDSDKCLCILACSALLQRQWDGPYAWTHGALCSNLPPCALARQSAIVSLGLPVQRLVALDPSMSGAEALARLCFPCQLFKTSDFKASQQEIWNDLPSIFGIPSWADIETQMSRQGLGPTATRMNDTTY
ncbi:hypothetical protein FB451DRAFT_1487113 [Mycena latifolia]|nr:hypothetical protein FB451DRAFT_1487113 [Mycena latifolia]